MKLRLCLSRKCFTLKNTAPDDAAARHESMILDSITRIVNGQLTVSMQVALVLIAVKVTVQQPLIILRHLVQL
jgi:hypothetical protein